MEPAAPKDRAGLAVKFGFYLMVAFVGLAVFGFVLSAAGYLIAAAGSVFFAALTANGLALRVFERMPLAAAGLRWRPGSARNLLSGFAAGVLGASAVTLLPAALRLASFVPAPEHKADIATALFVSTVLLFGAFGEELLFRGYGFQTLVSLMGPWPTLALTAALFGFVHMNNINATLPGVLNTAGFGIVLGYAFLRTGELWLSIGLHFGWNWVLPLAGVHLSGFKMGLTGYALRWNVSEVWSGGEYGPEGSVLTSLVVAALLVWLRFAPLVRQDAPLLEQAEPGDRQEG